MFDTLYPFVLTTHIITASSLVAIVVATDLYASLWVLGKKPLLNPAWLHRSHNLIWAGLFLMVVTGLVIMSPYPSYLLHNLAFQIKLLFIAALIVNALFIGRHMLIASNQTFASLTNKTKTSLIISGAVSTVAWIGALIAANNING